MNEKIRFPIVTFQSPGIVYVYRNQDELERCSRKALKNGYFVGLILVDSNGIQFKVNNAKKKGYAGPLWGLDIFLDQKLKVELNFSNKSSKISLEDLKKMTIKTFKQDRFFWESGGDFDELILIINKTSTIAEIIQILQERLFDVK